MALRRAAGRFRVSSHPTVDRQLFASPTTHLSGFLHTAPVLRSLSLKIVAVRYALHIQLGGVFDWDRRNLKKIKAHGIDAAEAEEALSISPIPIYEQDSDGESRYVYYGETASLRLLAVVLTERNGRIRVITAYELDAGQKRDYLERRLKGE